jgi:hypothetical protein
VVGEVGQTSQTCEFRYVSGADFEKVQTLIIQALEAGAAMIAGGPGRPEGITRGYFVKPTVFAGVRNKITIAREEIRLEGHVSLLIQRYHRELQAGDRHCDPGSLPRNRSPREPC